MSKLWLNILIVVILLCLPAISSFAVAPPNQGIEMPTVVKEAQKELSKTYGRSGIAKLLKSIKLEREIAAKNGTEYRSRTLNISMPVLMGNYSDVSHIFTSSEFQEHLFGSNPTGSMSEYYNEVSYGQFLLSGTVYGPYTAAESQSYYAIYAGAYTFPGNSAGFLWSLLESADPGIDFTQYDNDGPDGIPNSGDDDGIVDGLAMIFPEGDLQGGDDDNMATLKADLITLAGSMYTTNDSRFGGGYIRINDYLLTSAEIGDGTADVIQTIGGFCHEYGHIMGLPDLYDIDGSSYGIGSWCLMSYGSHGATYPTEASYRPVHMSAWCKEQLGFVIPIDINGTETITIPPIEINPVVYRLWDDSYQGGRYFLVENRRALGFDQDLLGEGLVVWHCNNDISMHNKDDDLRIVDIEEADGLDHIHNDVNVMDAGDVFPGSSNNISFNDLTYPNSNDIFGEPTGVSIEDVSYGPNLNITATLTQRNLEGYTLTYHSGVTGAVQKWFHGLGQPVYGAVEFTPISEGILVGVQLGTYIGFGQYYSIRVFKELVDNCPVDQISITDGSFYYISRAGYYDVSLSSAYGLTPGESFLIDMAWEDNYMPYTEYYPLIEQYPYTGKAFLSQNGLEYELQTDRDFAIKARVKYCYDSDGDGYNDEKSDPTRCGELDNCTDYYNPDQTDTDGDGIGDVCDFTCGDSDGSGIVDILDVVFIINYRYREGPEPYPLAYSDVDGNGSIDILDAVYIINFKYREGPEPACII